MALYKLPFGPKVDGDLVNMLRLIKHPGLVLAILGVACASADELRLANGDVLRGKLVSQEEGRIRFASPVLGVIDVAESSAKVVRGSTDPESATSGDAHAPNTGGELSIGDGKLAAGSNWRSKVDVGFNWQDGSKEKQDISLRFESRRKLGRSDYRIQARYLFSETNGTTSADSRDAGLRWRRDFNERWFSQTNTTYSDDAVREIDLNVDQNVGFGYRLLTSERAKANFGAGVTVQYRHAAGADEGVAKFGEFFQDLVWRFNERFEFAQEASALYSPDDRPLGAPTGPPGMIVLSDVPNYRISFESVLRGYLTTTLSLNLRFEYEFDNAIANRDARADQRISTSLGYAF